MAENVGHTASNSGPPGATAVDFFPFREYCFVNNCLFTSHLDITSVKHFPSWFPGTFYANFARNHRAIVRELHDYPYNAVKEQLVCVSVTSYQKRMYF